VIDVRLLRSHPEKVREGLAKRGESGDVDRLLRIDEEYRRLLGESERLKAERNARSKEIGLLISSGARAEADGIKGEMRAVGERIKALDDQIDALKATLDGLLLELPNLPHESVPAGDASANQIMREWGKPPTFDFDPKPHWEIGEAMGILDLQRAAIVAGSGFVGLVGEGAALARALV
jgi:seryl-tRNA synthetase